MKTLKVDEQEVAEAARTAFDAPLEDEELAVRTSEIDVIDLATEKTGEIHTADIIVAEDIQSALERATNPPMIAAVNPPESKTATSLLGSIRLSEPSLPKTPVIVVDAALAKPEPPKSEPAIVAKSEPTVVVKVSKRVNPRAIVPASAMSNQPVAITAAAPSDVTSLPPITRSLEPPKSVSLGSSLDRPPTAQRTMKSRAKLEDELRRNRWLTGAAFFAATVAIILFIQAHRAASSTSSATAATNANASPTETSKTNTTTSIIETTAAAPPAEPPAAKQSDPSASAVPAAAAAPPPPTEPKAVAPAGASVATTTDDSNVTEDMLPTSAILHRADASLRANDVVRAEQRYRLVLAKDPRNVEALTGRGEIARRQGDQQGAIALFQRALDVSPHFVPALLGQADVQWERADYTNARTRYTEVVERLGEKAPARAKERSAGPSSKVASQR